METIDKEKIARENILRDSEELSGVSIKGYDFDKGVDYSEIIKSFSSTGYQASHLSKAIEIVKKMRESKSKIFLGYTSNMVSSGLREIFRYLAKHKKVDVIVTTAGGIEEDFIKCFGDFILGDFKAPGIELREKAVNRIGNIFVPNSRYLKFEDWIMPILEEFYLEQRKTGKAITPSKLIWELGMRINNEQSIYYWAAKNGIPVYCPAIMDGSLGDMIYFFKYQHSDFAIDVAEDGKNLNDSTIGLKKSGVIILGSGTVKHSILNAHLYRDGADYAVYINTAQEFDGSDAGATPDEAVSWGKLKGNCESVKVTGDASILFPILVAESFAD
ncbi:deoxyhypusine synthase [Candidatus Pacearchaeota archaeon CG10_big_fil_rev_8_21_14_0_10_31_9]|nr:MAG: deoxyhypusine synthase [Candidatus Pacearchaeota archaeon CG1_02_32_21]PIN95461.1 MAG: deoxyhypusine synthase [Candidatus Pacearchaeota archaeon CG10_big_fil_rev_8_21_14_0_10_31_9]PIZ82900.1 MAG: deoxyhypusine synthase [Candidatus Pacearchaeota archaeon CG_4_10_14_0_2_um_filter_05_32_18]